jgi:hypothetical protein
MRLFLLLRRVWDDPPNPARGAIAQLEERLDRTQEVAGSSPASSITQQSLHIGDFSIRRWPHIGDIDLYFQALMRISA